LLDFARWIDDFAPADSTSGAQLSTVGIGCSRLQIKSLPQKRLRSLVRSPARKAYASNMDVPGLLRPWMLAFRSDFGISGFIDPEQAIMLMELIGLEGCWPQNHIELIT
jgi:hypothetical protein